jgi:hypothetical protein
LAKCGYPARAGCLFIAASHFIKIAPAEADQWPDDLRISDLEPRFVCKVGGIRIELINWPFLQEHRGSPAEYKAGLDLAIERGWLMDIAL